MRLYTASGFFFILYWNQKSTLVLISSLVLQPLVTYYILIFKLIKNSL